jgi:PH (Pleckstrin Homology) domain-containing protein
MTLVPTDVAHLLGPSEKVELYVKEKIFHPTIKVDSVVLTNERIILRHPRDLGLKKDFTDYSYTDIANVILDKGILRSSVKCVLRFRGDPLHLNDLPNADAEKAYGIIRENLVRYQTPFSTGYPTASPAVVTNPQQQTAVAQGVFCKKCGQRSAAGSRFCAACGSSL